MAQTAAQRRAARRDREAEKAAAAASDTEGSFDLEIAITAGGGWEFAPVIPGWITSATIADLKAGSTAEVTFAASEDDPSQTCFTVTGCGSDTTAVTVVVEFQEPPSAPAAESVFSVKDTPYDWDKNPQGYVKDRFGRTVGKPVTDDGEVSQEESNDTEYDWDANPDGYEIDDLGRTIGKPVVEDEEDQPDEAEEAT